MTTHTKALRDALKQLTFMAETSGGVAGRDEGLVAAIEQARAALATIQEDVPIADWLEEAAEDITHWGLYASDYFKNKHDLAGDVRKYRERAALVAWGGGWQPIETAPKDGTPFVGLEHGEYGLYYRTSDTPDDAAISLYEPTACYPTLWAPLLPIPPAPSTSDREGE